MGGNQGCTHSRSAVPEPSCLLSAEPSAGHQDSYIFDASGGDVNTARSAIPFHPAPLAHPMLGRMVFASPTGACACARSWAGVQPWFPAKHGETTVNAGNHPCRPYDQCHIAHRVCPHLCPHKGPASGGTVWNIQEQQTRKKPVGSRAYGLSQEQLGTVFGAGNKNRTRDPLITSQVLYQLSYAGVGADYSAGRTRENIEIEWNFAAVLI